MGSRGEFSGYFKVESIAGNRKAIWLREINTNKKRVLLVGKKNIDFFKDNDSIFYVERTADVDIYKIDGKEVLRVKRKKKNKNKKNKNKKSRK